MPVTIQKECQRIKEIMEAVRFVVLNDKREIRLERRINGYDIPISVTDSLEEVAPIVTAPSNVWKRGEKKKFLEKVVAANRSVLQSFDIEGMRNRIAELRNLGRQELMELYSIDKGQLSRAVNSNKMPRKLCYKIMFALRLDLDKAVQLLGMYGFAFNMNEKSEVIFLICIGEGIYDPDRIDCILDDCGQKTFFSKEERVKTIMPGKRTR